MTTGAIDDLDDLLCEMLAETGGPHSAAEVRVADALLLGRDQSARGGRSCALIEV